MLISAIIITKNEEINIARCIHSLDFCDEVIVVDSGSTDQTCQIAKNLGAQVYFNEFHGFGDQKRYAVAKTKNDWVISIDADEAVSKELKNSIKELCRQENIQTFKYRFKILNHFMGKPLRFWRELGHSHVRLFHKEKANFNHSPVHEKVEGNGEEMVLDGHLEHHSYRDIHHYLEKLNFYTDQALEEEEKNKNLFMMLIRSSYTFFNIYLIQGAIRNGRIGLIWSLLSSFYNFIKYLKKYEKLFEN